MFEHSYFMANLSINFAPRSNVFIVHLEQVNAFWNSRLAKFRERTSLNNESLEKIRGVGFKLLDIERV